MNRNVMSRWSAGGAIIAYCLLMNLSAASAKADGGYTYKPYYKYIYICKISDPKYPVYGNFEFTVTGVYGSVYDSPGDYKCAYVPWPHGYTKVTITEKVLNGTELVHVSTDPSIALTTFDLTARTAVVSQPPYGYYPKPYYSNCGSYSPCVYVYFKNRKRPPDGGNEGCTPGFWKNHTSAWPAPYTPGTLITAAFPNIVLPSGYGRRTLLEALQGGGGSGLDGAATILLRAAVAALLNIQSDAIEYAETSVPTLIGQVNQALATNDRATILALAERLDRLNNGAGGCPLGGSD